MRLAVFTSQFPSLVSTFFARDMRALLESGIEIDVFPLHPLDERLWPYVPKILSAEVLPRDRVHHVGVSDGLRPGRRRSPRSGRPFLGDLLAISWSASRFGPGPLAKSAYAALKGRAWAMSSRGNYDHVLAYWGNYAATSAYVFHRMTNPATPFSMFLHAGADLYRTPVYLKQKLLYADNIVVVCEFSRRFIEQTYGSIFGRIAKNVHVYHPGLDLSDYAFAEDGRFRGRVIAVGRFDRLKGFDNLIRAVDKVRRAGRDVELELVGDGEERPALERLADRLGVADRVRFRGWKSAEEVRVAIKEAAVLAHPSTGLGDAVPTVIKESMAVGTPVVASAVAGIPELLDEGRCGVLVPPRNVDALADALEALLADDAARRRYARMGRQFAEKTFDLWRNGKRLADLLLSSTRRAGRPPAVSRHAASA